MAPGTTRERVPVALAPPGASQPGTHRGLHQLLQASVRAAREWYPLECRTACGRRPHASVGRDRRRHHRSGRAGVSLQSAHAVLAGFHLSASREPSSAPRDRDSPWQLFGSAALGHAVWHLRQPAWHAARMRLRRQSRTTAAANASGENAMNRRETAVFAFLVTIGTLQMAADVLAMPGLKAIAAATQVSPAMRVFTAHQGYETHAARFRLSW